MIEQIRRRLFEGVDPASLVVFRVVYGMMAALSAARFFWYGWIDRFFHGREMFFQFPGFEWVQPLPHPGMHVLFAILVVAGIGVAVGAWYRLCVGLFVAGFTYVGLIDTTHYLNHYWFFRFVGFLMLFMPLAEFGSVDAVRREATESTSSGTVPAWSFWSLRLQLGLVYFFAGLAKLQWDWLVRGQPLEIWLAARTDLPLVGPYLAADWLPNAMAVCGAAFDLTVFFFLLSRWTRPYAYAAVVCFHAATGWLFDIGMFPVIMIGLTPIFFAPDWPRRVLSSSLLEWAGLEETSRDTRPELADTFPAPRRRKGIVAALAVWFAVQIAVPLRHFAYPGDVSWTQEGFRFAWRVKIAERGGSLKFRVENPETGASEVVHPSRYLTRRQNELASVEPTKILQLAHRIAEDYREAGWADVEVRADAFVSLNGRRARRLVDPDVDLAERSRTLAPKPWILRWNEAEPRRAAGAAND